MSQKKCRGCKVKISKRQLRRIIKEEKQRLLSETRDQADQNLKAYQDSVYGGDYVNLEADMENAIWTAVEMYQEVNGVSEDEAKQLVVDHVTEIMGITR